MVVRLKPCTWLAFAVVATVSADAAPVVATAPPVPLARCSADAWRAPEAVRSPVVGLARAAGQVRHFERTNLTVSVGATTDGAIQVEARGADLTFLKKVYSSGRYTLELEAPRDKVLIGVTEGAITVARGRRTIAVAPDASEDQMDDVRRLLADSRAIRLLRAVGADFAASDDDSAASVPLLLADALVGELTGDVGAPRRVAGQLSRRARAQLRPASQRPNTCYYQWEQTILWAYMDLEECVGGGHLFLLCSLRWNMQAESAWFSFIACSGFGF